MESYPNAIDLSLAEIFAAASLLGGEMVVGVENLPDESLASREFVFLEGLRLLAERGLVVAGTVEDDAKTETDPSGNALTEVIGLEPVFAFMLLAITEPDVTFLLSRINELSGEILEVTFHLQGSRAVMLMQHGAEDYSLTPLDGAIDVQDMIEAIWNFVDMDEAEFSNLLATSPQSRMRGQLIALRQAEDDLSYMALAVSRDLAGLSCAERSSNNVNGSEFTVLEDVDLWDRINDIVTLAVYPGATVERTLA